MNSMENLQLEGPLTSAEVCRWHTQLMGSAMQGLPNVVYLSQVTRCDSSALALLVALQSKATKQSHHLTFENPPQALKTLAMLGGVDGLLGWESTEHES